MKYFKTFILTLLLGSQLSSVGQWRKAEMPGVSSLLYPDKIDAFGDTIIIHGYGNGVGPIYSKNNGETWVNLSLESHSVDFISGSKGIMRRVSPNDSLFYTKDGGDTWLNIPLPGSYMSKYKLQSDSSILGCGFTNEWVKTEDLGQSWQTIHLSVPDSISGYPAQIANYFTYGDTLIYIAGGKPSGAYNFSGDQIVYTSNDNGANWDSIVVNSLVGFAPNYNGTLTKIYPDSLIVTGVYGASDTFSIKYSNNYGITWDTIEASGGSQLGTYLLNAEILNGQVIVSCSTSININHFIAKASLGEDVLNFDYLDTSGIYFHRFFPSATDTIYASNIADFAFVNDSIMWAIDYDGYLLKYDASCPPRFFLGSDTLSCFGVDIDLSEYSFMDSIIWNQGSRDFTERLDSSGEYIATIYYGTSCVSSDTVNVFIPSYSLMNDSSSCNEPIVVSLNDFASYNWSSGYTTYSDTFYSSGSYWLEVTDTNGCSATDTFEITIFTIPTLEIQDTVNCGGSIVIQAPIFSSYAWSTGSSQSSETFATSGNYSLAITDSNGCEAVDTFEIDIYTLPTVTLIDTFLCPSESVQIDAGIFTSYVWSTGALTSTISTSTAGDYTVEVTDTNGCTAMDTATISSYPDVVFTLGRDTALCADSIALNVAPLKALATSYAWSTGDTSDIVVFNQSGVYWLEITDTNGCYGRDTINLTLHVAPNAPVINRVTDTLYTTSSLTHQWFKNGVVMSGQGDSTLSNITAGDYQVIVVDSNGCESDTSNMLIYTAGVRDVLADRLIYTYPNPTNGGVTVRFEDISPSEIVKMTVFSLQGQELDFTSHWEQDQLQLKWDIAPQPVWLVIQSTSGTFKKLLIER